MSKVIDTQLLDDLDGKSVAAETVKFGLDGKSYKIDLTEAHAAALRKSLEKYIAHGRESSRGRRRARRAERHGRRRSSDSVWAQEDAALEKTSR